MKTQQKSIDDEELNDRMINRENDEKMHLSSFHTQNAISLKAFLVI